MEAAERARVLIEQAEAIGEPPDDPLLLFSVLNSLWLVNYAAGNGDAVFELADKFLAVAEKQAATAPLMIGHRVVGTSMLYGGHLTQARAHLNKAIALYDPASHRPLAVRFSQDIRVSCLLRRSQALWLLGYPKAALRDIERAVKEAREIGHVASLAFALWGQCWMWTDCGNYAAADSLVNELFDLAEEKGALFWKSLGTLQQGILLTMTGKAAEATCSLPD
jgi:tetratricopeptide (TPR) repeat protein